MVPQPGRWRGALGAVYSVYTVYIYVQCISITLLLSLGQSASRWSLHSKTRFTSGSFARVYRVLVRYSVAAAPSSTSSAARRSSRGPVQPSAAPSPRARATRVPHGVPLSSRHSTHDDRFSN